MKIIHKQIYKENVFGGITNTTLCGRVDNSNNEKNNGMNIGDDFNCKLCLKISKTEWGKKIIEKHNTILGKLEGR
jgi:hypothetical protein